MALAACTCVPRQLVGIEMSKDKVVRAIYQAPSESLPIEEAFRKNPLDSVIQK
jgi:hypothetical protein